MPLTPEEQAALDAEQKPAKIEFTTEQQEAVNRLINERFAKVTSKHEQELARLKKERDDAVLARGEQQTPTPTATPAPAPSMKPDEAQHEQYKQLIEAEKQRAKNADILRQRAEDEVKQSRAEVMKVKKQQAMINAAGKHNFYELNTALKLTEDQIEYDEDSKDFVVKENGIIKQNSSLQNMSLDEYFSGFAAQRPYLVNGDVKGGAGSHEGKITGNQGLVKSKDDLKNAKEKSDFIGKFGYDKYAALPNH